MGATALRFDFNEISREVRDGEGVAGDFLFAAFGAPQRKGSISIYYAPGGESWLRTGIFEVTQDVDVASHVFCHDGTRRLHGYARGGRLGRGPQGGRHARHATTVTDLLGEMRLEVLPGAFDIEVPQDNFEPVFLRNVSTFDGVQELGEIHPTRLAKALIF